MICGPREELSGGSVEESAGGVGTSPTLQLGAGQVAIIPVPPGTLAFTVAVPAREPAPVVVTGVRLAFGGESEIQSSLGTGLLSLLPSRSMTVGVIVMPEVLLAMANDVLPGEFPTWRLMDCTRQVSK